MEFKDFEESESASSTDWLLIQQTTGEYKKISVKNFLAGLTSSSASPPATGKAFAYAANGDSNGVFYYLGTKGNTQPWSNPVVNGSLIVTEANTTTYSDPKRLVDRQDDGSWYLNNTPNSWVSFDIGANKLLTPTSYSLKHDGESGWYLRSWNLEGSNTVADNTVAGIQAATWDVIDSVSNDTNINAPYKWYTRTVSTTKAYRWFRILQTAPESNGSWYLIFSEIELYGSLKE